MKFSFNLAGLITALAFLLALPGATLSAGDGKWDPMCGCWVKEEAPAPVVDEPAEEEVDAIEEATEDFKKLEGFLNLYVGEGDNEGIYYLEVPATELGHPILGAMMFSRGDGSSSLLHMPMGEMTMEWRAHADGKRLNLVRPQMDLRIDPDSELAQAFQMGTFDGVPMMVFEPVAVRHASPVEEGEGEGEGDLEAVEGEDEDVANPCSGMMSTAHQVSFTREGEEGEEELFVDPISGKWKGSMSLPDFGEMESFTMFLTLDGEDVTGTMEGDMGMEEEEIEGSFDGKTLTFGFSEAEDGFSMSMDFSFDLVKENTLKGTWTMTMSGQGMSEKMEGTAEARRKGGGAGDAGGFEDDDEEPITHYLIDISDTIWDGFGGLNIRADRDLSRIVSTKAYPENLEFDFEFSVGSRLMGVHLSLARLPEVPMTPRVSDQRVGYFTTEYLDMGVETTDGALERMANRWRLEKADPDADISAPIKPITYYVDPSVPPRWRPYVKEGIELWNKAFEAAGWIGAVRAVLPTDEDWPEDYDAGDIRYSSVSWAPSLRSTFAIGPSNVDPRTGEILNADIVFTASWIRAWTEDYELEGSPMMNLPDAYEMLASPTIAQGDRPAFLEGLSPELVQRYCALLDPIAGGDLSAHLLRSVLINDGLMLPGEEIPEEFVAQGLVEVTMHEVGHTLGLRHNFKSSSEIPWESLNDTEYTQEHGLISSVMDYASANISSDRGNQGDYYSRVVGDYDVWNIQYGYTDLSDEVEGEQHSFLAELAGRSAELGHAFGTDEDSAAQFGWDPYTNYWDLSSDPIAFFKDRAALGVSLWDGMMDRTVNEGEAWGDYLGGVATIMHETSRGGPYLAKFIGGHDMSRAHRGDPNAPAPISLIPAQKQREALDGIIETLVGESVVPNPEAYPYMVRSFWAFSMEGRGFGPINYEIRNAVLSRRAMTLLTLFDGDRMMRIQDNAWLATSQGDDALTLEEVFSTIHGAIWEEGALVPSDGFDRDLQSFWVTFLLFGGFGTTSDYDALAITALLDLHEDLTQALASEELDGMNRAHFRATRHTIAQALELH